VLDLDADDSALCIEVDDHIRRYFARVYVVLLHDSSNRIPERTLAPFATRKDSQGPVGVSGSIEKDRR
jgi:hypothetical protein